MAEFVVSCVLEILTHLLLHETGKFVPEIHGRMELILMKLRQLQSILEIADARQQVSEGIRSWVAETREVAYDIEDLLLVAVSSKKQGTMFSKYTHLLKEATSNNPIEYRLQVIEAKISSLESDLRVRNIKPRQKWMSNPISQRYQHRRRTYSHQVEEDFVGLDEDVHILVTNLVKGDGNKNYQVVSITGMGGIGKTTIAKKIYYNLDVRNHFQAFAWVCVSQQWEQDDILQRILVKLEPEKKKQINKMKVDELVEELFDVQKRKRCLIVLDDVWEADVWDVIRPSFPTREMHSKVLITTRKKEVARYIDTENPCYLYEQRHLNEKESWELLKKKVYRGLEIAGPTPAKDQGIEDGRYVGEQGQYSGDDDDDDDDDASSEQSFHSCSSLTYEEEDETVSQLHKSASEDCIQDQKNQIDMEKLGKDMVGQCGGLPLAIIVLGGILITKSTVTEWRTVHQNIRNGINPGENKVHEVLALSYHDLPYQLKPCFLHLGNFPADSKIPTRKLYQLWAAEGFILPECHQDEEETSIMDLAEYCLRELVQRCMVQVRVDEATGKFKSCQLHDLMRELCLLKGKEENFLKKVPLRHEPELTASPSTSTAATPISYTRRLSISVYNDFDRYFPPKKGNFEHIRSALFFSRLSEKRNLLSTLIWLCNNLKLLRVLDLERFNLGKHISKIIGNLVYLKYLSIRGSQLYKLPSAIGKLQYLQTLDLRVPFLVCLTIPDVIWKLIHLRHLYLPPSHRCISKLQLGSLGKLEILKNFDSRVSDYKDIPKLTKLQKLAAIFSLDIESLEAMNDYLKMESNHIRESSFRIRYDFQSERDIALLEQLVGYVHLRKLDLIGIIHSLPGHVQFAQSLTKLTLRSSKLTEDPMATLEKLRNLHSLTLRKNVYEGKKIRCSSKGFPQLRFLEVQGMITLEYWKIEEGAMPNLQLLRIDECINLRMVPEGIKYVATLREFVIANMPDDFKHRVQTVQEEGGEDIDKVEHIPLITITETTKSSMKHLQSQLSGNQTGIFGTISPAIVPKEWKSS